MNNSYEISNCQKGKSSTSALCFCSHMVYVVDTLTLTTAYERSLKVPQRKMDHVTREEKGNSAGRIAKMKDKKWTKRLLVSRPHTPTKNNLDGT